MRISLHAILVAALLMASASSFCSKRDPTHFTDLPRLFAACISAMYSG